MAASADAAESIEGLDPVVEGQDEAKPVSAADVLSAEAHPATKPTQQVFGDDLDLPDFLLN